MLFHDIHEANNNGRLAFEIGLRNTCKGARL